MRIAFSSAQDTFELTEREWRRVLSFCLNCKRFPKRQYSPRNAGRLLEIVEEQFYLLKHLRRLGIPACHHNDFIAQFDSDEGLIRLMELCEFLTDATNEAGFFIFIQR